MPTKPNRLFYTVKLSSGLLKEYKYDLNLTFRQCLDSGLIISLSDSQMLKSIRDITGQKIDRVQLEEWYQERDRLKKSKNNSIEKRAIVKELQDKIYNMMYIPQYITVVMENTKDYERIFRKGFKFNGKTYKRGSCSASQARVSTIVFVDNEIKDELLRRLNNGRDLAHPLAPSKYNAYLGLYSSATRQVTKPRFCIVADYCENQKVDVNYGIETDWDLDDIMEERTMEFEFNRFDGSGLISPSMAEKWAEDLNEDYVPSQFCLRCAFTKGLVNEFDFVEWCQDENNGNYIIKDVYGKEVDLRNIDIILTEGQTKLWDSWTSQEEFERNCEENGIIWGITKYSPKADKQVGLMNYQYLQTLNLNDNEIKNICQDTVDYIKGVSYDDPYYTLLFSLGQGMDKESIREFLQYSDNYWLKSLIINHDILKDKYSRDKIRDMVVTRIEQACLGRLMVNGNYEAIVPDSYSFMQWITGQPVVGLLKAGQFYSQFWLKKGVKKIGCARSPMTYTAEWLAVDLPTEENTSAETLEKINKYFRYSYSGIIVNTHDEHTMRFAGSDKKIVTLISNN